MSEMMNFRCVPFVVDMGVEIMSGFIKAFFGNGTIAMNMEFLLRLLLAVICGGAIGYERKNRGKEAGIRTHSIVALSSALMMLVSMYGCMEVKRRFDVDFDSSRIAASIVSGVGFLGAGVIFVRSSSIRGLTTASGIWTTSGIGMALGSGMYFIGITSTVVIVLVQIILHKDLKFMHISVDREFNFVLEDSEEDINFIVDTLAGFDFIITDMQYERTGDGLLKMSIVATSAQEVDLVQVMNIIYRNGKVKSAEF